MPPTPESAVKQRPAVLERVDASASEKTDTPVPQQADAPVPEEDDTPVPEEDDTPLLTPDGDDAFRASELKRWRQETTPGRENEVEEGPPPKRTRLDSFSEAPPPGG